MKKFFAILLKKNMACFIDNQKNSDLQLKTKAQAKKGISGRVIRVCLNKHSTKFEVSDYVKLSKKQRSNVVDVLIKDIFQYNFTGICIRHRKDQFDLNTSFLIRNVFDQFPFELNVPLYSPIVDFISILFYRNKVRYITHSKYYYLRKKPRPFSTIPFDYVIGLYDADIDDAERLESFISLEQNLYKYVL